MNDFLLSGGLDTEQNNIQAVENTFGTGIHDDETKLLNNYINSITIWRSRKGLMSTDLT